MAVVLPQGRLNNPIDRDMREYLTDHCRILAVVGLHANVFKPHAGVKTSVLFVQKWNDDASAGALCPRKDDYPIFFATMQEPSKDNRGDKIYVTLSDQAAWATQADDNMRKHRVAEPVSRYNASPKDLNDFVLDDHQHLVVKHDLFSHCVNLKKGERTPDGIAESFYVFAEKEKLSFAKSAKASFQGDLHPSVAVKSLSATRTADRLDAEYFDPQFQVLLNRLRSQNLKIGDVAEIRKERFSPLDDESDFRYIEIGGLTSDGYAVAEKIATCDAPSRATWIVRSGDVITSMVRPIRRLTALIDADQDGEVCSSGFVVLKPVKISPEILFAYLRQTELCRVMNMYTTASMYPAISVENILELPFFLPNKRQVAAIEGYVRDARSKRKAAAQLVSKASAEYSLR